MLYSVWSSDVCSSDLLPTLIDNYDLFSANWIRDSSGKVIAIDRRFINSGGTLMRGVELDANLAGELAGGRWHVNRSEERRGGESCVGTCSLRWSTYTLTIKLSNEIHIVRTIIN